MTSNGVKLYNSLSRKKETLKPLRKGEVGLYTCGPTVYNYAHIGNLRTFIFEDTLERALQWNNYKVRRVMNLTDVGHLTGDTDTGKDKIEESAKAQKKTPAQIANFYTKAFLKDIAKLNIKRPDVLAPATEYVREMISLVRELFKKGCAYETPRAVYFDVTKFKKYGRLSGQSLKEKIKAARKEVIDDPEKKNEADFALWFKLVGRFKNHLQHWPSPWGEGFPGWHIECSAISKKFLGQPFDIHTGGVDHIGTHHENEIAQSQAAYGKPLAKIWMHGEFLVIDKKRMGKSEKNFITLEDVEKKGYDPLSYRYLTLTTHYRQQMSFSWKSLESAERGLDNLRNAYIQIRNEGSKEPGKKDSQKKLSTLDKKFRNALGDDLNVPKALAVTWETIKDKSLSAKEKKVLVGSFDEVLGLNLQRFASQRSETTIPAKIEALAQERELFRVNKQFNKADALRKYIRTLGYEIEDTLSGPLILKSHNSNGKNKSKNTAARSRS